MLLEAAKELDMAVVPEGGMAYYWNLNQIIDGHTTIEHAIPVAPLYEDVLRLFSASGTAYTPTLVVNFLLFCLLFLRFLLSHLLC